MGEILFLAHRIPFPPDRGDKIRSHHLLRAIARLAPVHVGCLSEGIGDLAHEAELRVIAASHCIAPRPPSLALAGIGALARGRPVSLDAFDSPALHRWVTDTLATRPIDAIFVFSGQMGQYVPPGFAGRLVVDLCDVDSAKFAAYAAVARGPRAWIDAREARLLAAEETRLAARADATLFISRAEAALFAAQQPPGAEARISVVPNGIDTADFDPSSVEPHSALTGEGPQIVFTGQMDYPPNVEAALRVIERILPVVRRELPSATFHVVGRCPSPDLTPHDGRDGVRVWGEVPDVRPFLAGADLVLAPLTIARGVQNKVLEAMAMARPILLTPGAATGIEALDGMHFVIAESDEQLARDATSLLRDGPRALALGAAARRFVAENQGWDAVLAPLAGHLGIGRSESARDAA
jgi:sugar transferase (PEP-CTERM/EpsH1 system associated)